VLLCQEGGGEDDRNLQGGVAIEDWLATFAVGGGCEPLLSKGGGKIIKRLFHGNAGPLRSGKSCVERKKSSLGIQVEKPYSENRHELLRSF